jgi:hypothetical protein
MPKDLKQRLDVLTKYKRVSKTSVLNRLVEDYCRDEIIEIEKDKTRIEVLHALHSINKSRKPNHQPQKESWEDSYDEPLDFSVTDDIDDPQDDGVRL